jgi:hypothetical protein
VSRPLATQPGLDELELFRIDDHGVADLAQPRFVHPVPATEEARVDATGVGDETAGPQRELQLVTGNAFRIESLHEGEGTLPKDRPTGGTHAA